MGNIAREDMKDKTDHLLLIGASNLKRTIPHLKRLGYSTTDATCHRATSYAIQKKKFRIDKYFGCCHVYLIQPSGKTYKKYFLSSFPS
jgi:hypothetical protein